MLAGELGQQAVDQLRAAIQGPHLPTYRFDSAIVSVQGDRRPTVRKTHARRVVSSQYGQMQAVEVVRAGSTQPGAPVHRSAALSELVPAGARYAFDLIVHVGVQTFLEGHTLAQVQTELRAHQAGLSVPLSSLYELKMKFLFYLGQLHQKAAPVLRTYLTQRGATCWLIDGTLEPGTPVFFGVEEAQEGWLLGCWKLATENTSDLTRCLAQAATQYGVPEQIWHDLSARMGEACTAALPGVPHRVCHYHLASDVGQDLYKGPQAALAQRLQALRLQGRLTQQRRSQTQGLQAHRQNKRTPLVLEALLRGQSLQQPLTESLSRELLLALHLWILDYASDGQRQGFPFDPHLLYYHRRIVQVVRGLDTLWQRPGQASRAPPVLRNFRQLLKDYLADPQITQSAQWFEAAHALFERFRAALRLTPQGPRPLRDPYALELASQRQVTQDLQALRQELRQPASSGLSSQERKLRTIVLTHLDKYWDNLGLESIPAAAAAPRVRTTNGIETHWTKGKRSCRQIHGRNKLTRDFQALPAEFMLVPNLRNTRYQELVLGGDWQQLPKKFAQLPIPPGSFSKWRHQERPEHCGRLPKSLLREDNFIDRLIGLFPKQTPEN